MVISTIAQWSIAIRGFKLRDTRFERVIQDLERRRRVLEEEIIFEDRRLNHADRVERQLLAVLPIEDQHLKYDSFLSTHLPATTKKTGSSDVKSLPTGGTRRIMEFYVFMANVSSFLQHTSKAFLKVVKLEPGRV